MFPLCRTCCKERNPDDCTHEQESQQEFLGTWVIYEVLKALEKGYRIKDIYVIWKYQIAKWDGVDPNSGLFVDYINTFLKIKQ